MEALCNLASHGGRVITAASARGGGARSNVLRHRGDCLVFRRPGSSEGVLSRRPRLAAPPRRRPRHPLRRRDGSARHPSMPARRGREAPEGFLVFGVDDIVATYEELSKRVAVFLVSPTP